MSVFERVVDLAVLMYEESSYGDIKAHREDIHETLLSLCEQEEEGTAYFGVLYSAEEPIGFLVATILDRHIIWGTKYKVAAELAWYIHPAYRKFGGASILLDSFEKWCKDCDVDLIINAAMHNDSFDQVKHIYEKNGYTASETAFIKHVKQPRV